MTRNRNITLTRLLLALVVCLLPRVAVGETQTRLSMTVPSLVMGTSGTFSSSTVTGAAGTNTGTVTHNYSGQMNFVQSSGTGRFASYNGVSRFGIGYDVFQVFQSFVSPNYFTVVSSGTACPSNTTYDWMMVRFRTHDAPRGPMSANANGLNVGGVFSYNASTSTFTATSSFDLVGPNLNSSPSFGITGYSGATCASGNNLGQSTGTSDLDPYLFAFYGAYSFAIVTDQGDPLVILGAPQQTLTTANMAALSNYVFTGISTVFTNATTQTQTNVYLSPDSHGTTYTINQETSLTNPSQYTTIGTLACTNLNSPTTGFCSGTLTLNGVSGSSNVVCEVAPNSTENLMFCSALYPGSPLVPITFIAKTVNQAVLQVTVSPADASVTSSGNSTTVTATLQNLSSRYIPTISDPSNGSDDLSAPWSDTNAYQGAGTCTGALNAYASCTFPVKFSSAGIGTVTSVLRAQYANGVGTPYATANLVGVTGLSSLAVTPAVSYAGLSGSQQFTATATYSDNSTQNVTAATAWTSSNSTVAAISSSGLATWAFDGSATLTATLGGDSATDNVTVVTPPVLTTIGNYNFPSLKVNQGSTFTFDFNNVAGGTPGNDTNMTYACVYNQTFNSVFSPGTPCTSLPGTATFNTSTGVFSWTPSLAAWGPYQFQITGTLDGTFSTTETFYIDVNPLYSTTHLVGNWDAQFANFTTPYSSPNTLWDDLTGNGYGGTSNSTSHATWTGSGTYSSPYALSLDGSGYVNFGSSMLSAATQFFFSAWINPSSATSTDTIILGNSADATQNGFTVRQSLSSPGKIDFIAGVPTATSSYSSTVLADSPISYWQFGESSGTSATDSSGHSNTGTYQSSPTLGQTGPLKTASTTAALLNGSSQYVSTTTSYSNPQTFSIEIWIKTAAGYGSGGRIMGFGNSQTGSSSDYDRHLWMTNSGLISFGVYNSATQVISSSASYNDGNWHHLVGTFTTSLMALYIDGTLVNSTTTAGSAQSYTGYWRVGYDNMNSWPSQPSSSYFAGTVGQAAVYSTSLSSTRVAAHYLAAEGTTTCTSATTFTNGAWENIAGITNGSSTTFYVNGRAECSTADFGSSSPGTPFIAGATGSYTKNWTGSIADLKMYATTSGTVGTSSTVLTDFQATADRYRQNPVGNIVTSGLVLNLDAANAYQSLSAFPNGCATSSLTWLDLSTNLLSGTLTNFSSCGSSLGWNGTGTSSNPFRLSFSSASSSYVALSNPVSGTNVFSVEVWFRTTSTGSLVGTSNAAVNGSESTWDPVIYVDSTGILRGGDYSPMYASTVTVNDGAWRQAVVTGNGSTVSLYINGALNTTTASGSCENLAANMQIGTAYTYSGWTNGNNSWYYFTGDVAKVAVYNTTLTQAQIHQNCLAIQSRFSGLTCN